MNQTFTFKIGDPATGEMSKILDKKDSSLVGYVITSTDKFPAARKESIQRLKLLAAAPEMYRALASLLDGNSEEAMQVAEDIVRRLR